MSETSILQIWHLGRRTYEPVWEFQKRLHAARYHGDIPDTLLTVEHEPVYTIGKSGGSEHIVGSDEFLEEEGIEVFQIGRGGDVTYHGPGQIVGYPIFDLREHRKNVRWYMRTLEETIIQVLSDHSIRGEREEEHPGVWVEGDKICAVGVRISRWVTFHGIALNLQPDMTHFEGIVPCGIEEKGVTSMTKETGREIKKEEVLDTIAESFRDVFGFDEIREEEIQDLKAEPEREALEGL